MPQSSRLTGDPHLIPAKTTAVQSCLHDPVVRRRPRAPTSRRVRGPNNVGRSAANLATHPRRQAPIAADTSHGSPTTRPRQGITHPIDHSHPTPARRTPNATPDNKTTRSTPNRGQ